MPCMHKLNSIGLLGQVRGRGFSGPRCGGNKKSFNLVDFARSGFQRLRTPRRPALAVAFAGLMLKSRREMYWVTKHIDEYTCDSHDTATRKRGVNLAKDGRSFCSE